MKERFTVQRIDTELLPGEDEETYDEHPQKKADLREAIDALESNCWDNVDARGDGTIICYPADHPMNMRTGAYEGFQIIVKADKPHNANRLMDLYESRRNR